jgi:hypothetical protein
MDSESSKPKTNPVSQLFWLSLVALFLELVAIRWMSSELRAFSIYKNFPLIACYVGLGFGLSRTQERLFKWFPLLILIFTACVATTDWTGLAYTMAPNMVRDSSHVWWDWTHPSAMAMSSPTSYMAISLIVFFAFLILVALTFAALGERLGRLFDQTETLKAYLWNLSGSAAGIILFGVLAYFCTPPVVWLAVGLVPAVFLFRKQPLAIVALVATVIVAGAVPAKGVSGDREFQRQSETMWSPYYRFDVTPLYFSDKNNSGVPIGYTVAVNKAFFQQPLNLSEAFLSSLGSDQLNNFAFNQYDLPYQFCHPRNVLILGSGTGNDIAAALKHGAEHVDAVEIDPLMVKLGKRVHPEHPYQSPKVHSFINDARAFLRQTDRKYDLVVTGLLDSHTAVGNSLSVRLDDYVYTVQGLRDALSHLAPGGMLSVSYCATQNFISQRIAENLTLAMHGQRPLILIQKGTAIWHMLAPVRPEMQAVAASLQAKGFDDKSNMSTADVRPSTDDWPYLYLSPVLFDPLYIGVNLCILLLAWAACGRTILRNHSPLRWQLFFLGAAFLLLELSIIDRLALIFGTTWIVNSVSILAVLIAVILANIAVMKRPDLFNTNILYPTLLVSLAVLYLIPVDQLSAMGMWAGGCTAAAISAVPVFIAGLIFSGSFAREQKASTGLAFNMFGAVIGGLLEYTATYTGIRSLLLVAMAIYAVSLLFCHKSYSSKDAVGP